ncbi:MAG: flagellin [Lachnospiraceae bacterium]
MRLNHNAMAFTAANNYSTINRNLSASMARLSSGYKINKSSDDPTGKAISQRMNAQIRGLNRASANANDGISLIQTAEGSLDEAHSILARMRELAVQAANSIYDVTDCDAMQAEIKQLQDELDRVAETTQFNGRTLLNGELNRKGYTDSTSVSIAEIGGDVPAGEYQLSISQVGETAKVTTAIIGGTYNGASGSISINGLDITVATGTSATELQTLIRDHADRIGIDYDIATGVFESRVEGSAQTIKIDASNDDLRAFLGVPAEDSGTDAVADFGTGARVGFSDTATIETDGNRITVTDKDGFSMVLDATKAEDITVTVLTAGPMVVQVGGNEGQTLDINIGKTTANSLGVDKIYIYTHEYASEAIDKLDAAVVKVSRIRSSLGAYENRMDYTSDNLDVQNENLTSAVSRIIDTDMAEEITEYTQKNVLSQSAMQMLTKANAFPEGLLQLFQR